VKYEEMLFKGIRVGIQIIAESENDRVLLGALSGLTAAPVTEKSGPPKTLYLCPSLPWGNHGEVISFAEDQNYEEQNG
jgi:hypothetical protein